MMRELAKAILEAQKIREESFNKDAADEAEKSSVQLVNLSKFYGKSMKEAADEAAGNAGFDKRGTLPVYLLCQYCWNDSQQWANEILSD